MKKNLLFSLMAMVIAGSLITVTGAATVAAGPRTPAGEFRVVMPALSTEALGPVMGTIEIKWYQILLYDLLVGIEPPSNEVSTKTGVAYRWEHSPDYKDWTFYLRKGIKFHNGDELTAEDVKYTLDRALGPVGMSSNKSTIEKMIESIDVIDKYKVIIHCKRPDSMLPLYMSAHTATEAMIVPKKYIEEKGDEYFRAHPIGSGPYKFKEHVAGDHILFEAAGEHWALGVPKYKYVRLSIVPESMARIGLLERGEADVVSLPRERVKDIKARGFPIVEDPAQCITQCFMNETWDKKYPLSDIRVRQALNIAIDRQAIHQTLFGGLGQLAPFHSAIPASIGYEPAPPVYPNDPEKARALLKEAGYGPGNPCTIRVYSFPNAFFPEGEQFVESSASYWEKVGFAIKIVKVPEYGVVRKKWQEHTMGGAMHINTVGGRLWPMPATNIINRTGSRPFGCASIPELDKAIDEALATINPEKRAALSNKVYRMIYDNYLHLPLVLAPGCYAVNPKTIPNWQDWHMVMTTYDINMKWPLFH